MAQKKGTQALVDLESWRWQHRPIPNEAPKRVLDCLLLICHLRNDERNFRLDRIIEVKVEGDQHLRLQRE